MAARGPRGKGSDTRGEIVAAAERLFSDGTFESVSVRAIAREAGVDPALVRHYFADKAELFVVAMRPIPRDDPRIAAIVTADRATIGRTFMETFVGLWDDPELNPRLRAILVSALTSPDVAAQARSIMLGELLMRITGEEADGGVRASAAASQLVGLAVGRYLLRLPGLVDLSRDELVATFAPTMQRYLTGDLGSPGGSLGA